MLYGKRVWADQTTSGSICFVIKAKESQPLLGVAQAMWRHGASPWSLLQVPVRDYISIGFFDPSSDSSESSWKILNLPMMEKHGRHQT
jgi:hypothetical protein